MNDPVNLILDVGNSFIKLGVFRDHLLVKKDVFSPPAITLALQETFKEFPDIAAAALSKVADFPAEALSYLEKRVTVFTIDHTIKLPFNNAYTTPHTLGVDRIALVAAACKHFPKSNVLLIDTGSCITYDILTAENVYLGGSIAPGLQMRYKSLHTFTANLPLLALPKTTNLIGDNTENAIHSGVVNGVLAEIDGIITQYCNTYADLIVILSGGDTEFLSKRLKNRIFAHSNFLLDGLNYLLAFNKHQ